MPLGGVVGMSGRTRCFAAGAPVNIGLRFWPVFAGVFLCAGGKPILNNTPPPLLGTLQSFSKVSPKVSGSHQDDFQLTRIVFGLKKLRDPLYMAKQNF